MAHKQPMHRMVAFTLVEMVIVLVLLGVLAALAIPTFQSLVENGRIEGARLTAEAVAENANALVALESGTDASAAIDGDTWATVSGELTDASAMGDTTGGVVYKSYGSATYACFLSVVDGRAVASPGSCASMMAPPPPPPSGGEGDGGGGGGGGEVSGGVWSPLTATGSASDLNAGAYGYAQTGITIDFRVVDAAGSVGFPVETNQTQVALEVWATGPVGDLLAAHPDAALEVIIDRQGGASYDGAEFTLVTMGFVRLDELVGTSSVSPLRTGLTFFPFSNPTDTTVTLWVGAVEVSDEGSGSAAFADRVNTGVTLTRPA